MHACLHACVRQPVALLALAPPTPPTEGHPIFDKMVIFIIIIISIKCWIFKIGCFPMVESNKDDIRWFGDKYEFVISWSEMRTPCHDPMTDCKRC